MENYFDNILSIKKNIKILQFYNNLHNIKVIKIIFFIQYNYFFNQFNKTIIIIK